jgi:hypothetical protein
MAESNTPVSRLLGELLAAGLIRILAKKSTQNSATAGEISLDIPPRRSGPTNREFPDEQ